MLAHHADARASVTACWFFRNGELRLSLRVSTTQRETRVTRLSGGHWCSSAHRLNTKDVMTYRRHYALR